VTATDIERWHHLSQAERNRITTLGYAMEHDINPTSWSYAVNQHGGVGQTGYDILLKSPAQRHQNLANSFVMKNANAASASMPNRPNPGGMGQPEQPLSQPNTAVIASQSPRLPTPDAQPLDLSRPRPSQPDVQPPAGRQQIGGPPYHRPWENNPPG
jgi:hypothetical protein